ncbi:alkane hydroxylase MAH1-like [Juglans microcarpa x Juglans regia]|uniref:alkane hydroxylase MAH1-like n=1 Tax=Juglans microcarpa x Juglans regia TaxID=2249226 RepID=UPI001B7DA1D1|nr:alkane hydroxylase MAH1-like [Juglans microcarpa x Juglans regia]
MGAMLIDVDVLVQILVAFLWFLPLCLIWSWKRTITPVMNWPLVGMLPGLLSKLSDIHEYATQVLKQNGGTFQFKGPWLVNMDFLVTCDPMNVRYISAQNFANYTKGPEFKKLFEPFGDGVLNSDTESWKSYRKLIHSIIKHRKFQMFQERSMQQKVSQGLFPILEHVSRQGIVVDLQDVFQRFTFDNICLLVMGFDPKCLTIELPEVDYRTAFDKVEEAIFYRHIVPESIWKLQKWLNMGEENKLRRAMEILDPFLYQRISSKKGEFLRRRTSQMEQVEDGKGEDFDLLTACMAKQEEEAKGEVAQTDDYRRSDRYLRDIAFNFMAAGKDTINAGLTWLFWLIATHPSIEEKILEEIKENLQAKDDGKWRLFSIEEQSKLVYLHAAICEALRLYPSVPFNHRFSIEPDVLPSGHRVNANTKIMVSLYSMGSMEGIWGDDCLEFKPERWISEKEGIVHIPSYKFIAFNSGPRSCLGQDLTFFQMKTIVPAILWNYRIQVVEGHPISPLLSVMLHMKHGLKVRVSKRS